MTLGSIAQNLLGGPLPPYARDCFADGPPADSSHDAHSPRDLRAPSDKNEETMAGQAAHPGGPIPGFRIILYMAY